MLAGEGRCHRGLVVEEREGRLEPDLLSVALAAEDGRERPEPVRAELAADPCLRLRVPTGACPRRTFRRYRRASLLGEPALERGPELRRRELRRVGAVEREQLATFAGVELVQAEVVVGLTLDASAASASGRRYESIVADGSRPSTTTSEVPSPPGTAA